MVLTANETLPDLMVGSGTSNPDMINPLTGLTLYKLEPRVKGRDVPGAMGEWGHDKPLETNLPM